MPTFTRVCEVGRRVTPADDLPAPASGKAEQKVVDFERFEEAGLREGEWDVVFIVCVLKGFFSCNASSTHVELEWARLHGMFTGEFYQDR